MMHHKGCSSNRTSHHHLEIVLRPNTKPTESETKGRAKQLVFIKLREILVLYLHQRAVRAQQVTLHLRTMNLWS